MDSLAASGLFSLNNSSCISKGQFYTPRTVLDTVTSSQPVDIGVIEIAGRDVTGRIGVKANSIITGAVVDKTGETGTAAVCRLLLIPYGMYLFRHAVPTDKLYLEQELALTFEDAKKFLTGPSTIGLAVPGRQTLNNLKALTGEESLAQPDFTWASTSLCNTYPTAEEPGSEMPTSISRTVGSRVTDADLEHCQKLVEAAERKKAQTIEIQLQAKQTQTNLEALEKPGRLPKRQEKPHRMIDKHLAVVLGAAFLVVVGFAVANEIMIRPHVVGETASTIRQANSTIVQQVAPPPEQKQQSAPFVFPTSIPRSEPPPPTSLPTAPAESVVSPVPPDVSQTPGAPVSVSLGQDEVNRWTEEVRKNPADPKSRRELAQAYLLGGDCNSAIEQFYAVMKTKKVDAEEIIGFANNLMVFGSKDIARKFLTDVLRADPQQKEIRARLNEMR
ncbi:MAG: hypothetical protein AB7W16_22610 [Candidatus Obscuribacterales bacterium]